MRSARAQPLMNHLEIFTVLRHWRARRYVAAGFVGIIWLALSGIPTGLLDTPFYYRMTPVVWWDYPFWISGAVFVGFVAATYVGDTRPEDHSRSQGKTLTGALFSVFAIGCPICNALVVAVLGTGGALSYFAPVQPLLGLLSSGLLFYALQVRLRGERSCPVEFATTTKETGPNLKKEL